MAENTLNESTHRLQSNYVEEMRDKLCHMYFNFKTSLTSLSNIVKEEANKNPVLAILLGSICLFSALPVACFLVYCLVVTAIFLIIFVLVEGAALLAGLLVLAGFLFFTAMIGLGAGLVIAIVYTIFSAINPRNRQKIE